ncbi:DUF2975 domain-containing protein [Subtercola boreus]|nr:DUF2975 domain-containing protein [Subtercola boreus]
MSRLTLLSLRSLLVLLFAGALAAQASSGAVATALLSGVSAGVLVGVVIAGCVAVECVLVSAWMLVTMVHRDRIFDDRAHADTWVNTAIGALSVGAVIAAAGFVYFAVWLVADPQPTTLPLAVLALTVSAAATALALIVVVMRRLLHTAIRLQSELAEVI